MGGQGAGKDGARLIGRTIRRCFPSSGALSLAVLVSGVGLVAGPGLAHTQSGALGNGAASTDYYQIICSDDGTGPPASLSVQILDGAPAAAPMVSVQVRSGLELASSTDPVDGDTTASPLIHVNGGAEVVYEVLVDKSGAGSENYTLTFHCLTGPNGTGLHTGTDIVTRQNQ
jgi:hypothetical protein